MTVTTNMYTFVSRVGRSPKRAPRSPSPTNSLRSNKVKDILNIVSYNGNVWTLADKDYKALTGVKDIRYRKAISGRYILCNNQPVRYNKKGDYWKANSIYIKGDKLMIKNAKNIPKEINPTDFSLGEGRQ